MISFKEFLLLETTAIYMVPPPPSTYFVDDVFFYVSKKDRLTQFMSLVDRDGEKFITHTKVKPSDKGYRVETMTRQEIFDRIKGSAGWKKIVDMHGQGSIEKRKGPEPSPSQLKNRR